MWRLQPAILKAWFMGHAEGRQPDRFRMLEKAAFGGLLLLTLLMLRHADVSSAWRAGLVIVCGLSVAYHASARRWPWQGLLPQVRQLLLGWLLFVLVMIVASLAGTTWELARTQALQDFLLPATVPLLLAAHVRDQGRWKILLLILCAAMLMAMGRNFGQYVGEWSKLGGIPSDITRHRNYSGPLVFGLPMLLFFAVTARQAWGRAIGWGLVVLALLMVIGTGARGAWLGALAVVVIFLVLLRDRRLLVIAGVGAALAIAIGLAIVPPELLADRLRQGFDTSLRTTGTWGPALEMIGERPLLGFGYGNDVFHAEFNQRAATATHWSFRQSIGPHSFFLATAFAAGGLGLLCLLAVLALAIWRLVGCLRQLTKRLGGRDPSALSGVAMLAIVSGSYLIIGMVENGNWHLFGYWLGLTLAWIQVSTPATLLPEKA